MDRTILNQTEYRQLTNRIKESVPVVKAPSYEPENGSDIMKKLMRVNRRLASMTAEYRDGIENELVSQLNGTADRMDDLQIEAVNILKV